MSAQVELDLQPQPLTPVAAPVAMPVLAPAAAAAPAVASRSSAELWLAVHLDAGERDDAPSCRALLKRAEGFTPRVSLAPDALLLELAASQKLFGGLHAMLRALRVAFPAPRHLAMAPTPLAALLLARAGRNGCITSTARLRSRVAPLPLALLHWPAPLPERLHNMGARVVGDLLRLPRAGLARRIGPERLRELDRLVGHSPDPRPSVASPERFLEGIEPDEETCDRDRILAALAPGLERLECFLRARQRGVMALRLTLGHRAGPPTVCVLRCVAPEYRAARFTALLGARLESLQLVQPVRRLELASGRLRRLALHSQALWQPGEHGGTAGMQAPEFLQTLIARLGTSAVHGLQAIDEHRPERQWRRVPVIPAPGPQGRAASIPAMPPRPLALLSEPQRLHADVGHGGATTLWHEDSLLQRVSGPERIESGWWDGADIARDYYIARAASGALLWIFRECARPHHWYLHGCFA